MDRASIRRELLSEIIAEINQTIAFLRKNCAALSGHEPELMERETIAVLESVKAWLADKQLKENGSAAGGGVMGKTKIEWTASDTGAPGMTWNPVTGCTKVSQGCKNCYAKRDWARLAAMPNNVYTGREFEQVACHPERLDQPIRWRAPRRVFVNSMSDLFHENVSDAFIDQVFAVAALTSDHGRDNDAHTFMVLTKRPQRMHDYLNHPKRAERVFTATQNLGSLELDTENERAGCSLAYRQFNGRTFWPIPNIWLGVSVEDQATADERIPLLLQTPAAVRWISAEPLLGPVNLTAVHYGDRFYVNTLSEQNTEGVIVQPGIDWVVVGGESGPNARPMHPDWARSLRGQCAAAGVPFFFKQWGEWAPADDYPSEIQESYDVRGLTQDKSMRVGKKAAGRMLDGREWNEYPA